MKRSVFLVVPLIAALLLGACSSGSDAKADKAASDVTVYTPESLKGVVYQVVKAYNDDNPDSKVGISVEPRKSLESDIERRKAGVVAMNTAWMKTAAGSLAVEKFGRNMLVLAVPAGNPKQVTGFSDLQDPNIRKSVCFLWVPPTCGATVGAQLAANKTDLGVMWRSLALLPKGVEVVKIPDDKNIVVDYSYVALGRSEEAERFQGYLKSEKAKKIITRSGYLP